MPAIDRSTNGTAAKRTCTRADNRADHAVAVGQAVTDDPAENTADQRATDLPAAVIGAATLHHSLPVFIAQGVFIARGPPSTHRSFWRRSIELRHWPARISAAFVRSAPCAVVDPVVGGLPLALPAPLPAAAGRAGRRRGAVLGLHRDRCGPGDDAANGDGDERGVTKKHHVGSPKRRCPRRTRQQASH